MQRPNGTFGRYRNDKNLPPWAGSGSRNDENLPPWARSGSRNDENIPPWEEEVPTNFLYTLIVLNLALGVAVIILNSLVGHFYRKGKRSTASLLYLYLTGWDVTMGVNALIHAVYMITSLALDEQEYEIAFKVLLSGVYVVTNVVVRMSVFANTVLSVVRTINISRPFFRVRKRNLHIVYWVCFFFLSTLSAVDLWLILTSGSRSGDRGERPFIQIQNLMLLNPSMGSTILEVLFPPPTIVLNNCVANGFFHLATLITLACLAVHSKILLHDPKKSRICDAPRLLPSSVALANFKTVNKRGSITEGPSIPPNEANPNESAPVEQTRRRVSNLKQNAGVRTTITVMLLSAVFCLCNTVYTVFVIWLVDTSNKRGQEAREANEDPMVVMSDRLLFYVTSTFVPFLNSLINPLILICRSSSLNQSFSRSVRSVITYLSSTSG